MAVAVAPTEALALVALVPMGACSISFIATANATLQLRADPSMRGRVMALYAIAFLGSTPIGAPLVGWISDTSSPRVALLVGGVATLAASLPLLVSSRRRAGGSDAPRVIEATDAEPGEVVDFASAMRPARTTPPADTDRPTEVRPAGSAG